MVISRCRGRGAHDSGPRRHCACKQPTAFHSTWRAWFMQPERAETRRSYPPLSQRCDHVVVGRRVRLLRWQRRLVSVLQSVARG